MGVLGLVRVRIVFAFALLLVFSPLVFAHHDLFPPALNLQRTPVFPQHGESVAFYATAYDESGVRLTEIVFKAGAGPFLVASCPYSGVCVASTPPLAEGTTVHYYARAIDASHSRNEEVTPLFSFTVGVPATPFPSGDLLVKVSDCASNAPIAGAFVSIGALQRRTYADGSALIAGLPEGSHVATATAFGYAAKAEYAQVIAAFTNTKSICLNQLPPSENASPTLLLGRSPAGEVFQGEQAAISASSSDASGIEWTQVSYAVNGGVLQTILCQANFCALQAGPFLAGTRVDYSASSRDGAGNIGTAFSFFVVSPSGSTATPSPTPSASPTATPTPSPTPTISPSPTASPTPSPSPTPTATPTPTPVPGAECAVTSSKTVITAGEGVQATVLLSGYQSAPSFAQVNCGNGVRTAAQCSQASLNSSGTLRKGESLSLANRRLKLANLEQQAGAGTGTARASFELYHDNVLVDFFQMTTASANYSTNGVLVALLDARFNSTGESNATTYFEISSAMACTAACPYSSQGVFALSAIAGGVACFPSSVIVGAPATPDSENGRVLARVTRFESGRALKNARVTVGGIPGEKSANEFGETLFSLREGNYTISASADGYASNSQQVSVENRSVKIVEVRLSQVQCGFDAEKIDEFCDGRGAWMTVRLQNNQPQDDNIAASQISPVFVNGTGNYTLGPRQNLTVNFSLKIPQGFNGLQNAKIRIKGTAPSDACAREFLLNLCSGRAISIDLKDPHLNVLPGERSCTTLTVRNRGATAANVELFSFGLLPTDFSERKFFLGSQESKSVQYCVEVPESADGSSSYIVRAASEYQTEETLFSVTARGKSFFSVYYEGCVIGGGCACVEMPVEGRKIIPIDFSSNGGIAKDYAVRAMLSRQGLNAEPVQSSLQGFAPGTTRRVLLDASNTGAEAGDYIVPLALLSADSLKTVFEHDLCLAVPVQLKFGAEVAEKALLVPQPGTSKARLLVENQGNARTQFTLTENSSIATIPENFFELDAGAGKSVEILFDSSGASEGQHTAGIEITGENVNSSLRLSSTLTYDFRVVPANAFPPHTVVSGLALRQAEEFFIEPNGRAASFSALVQNNNPFAVEEIVVYAIGLPPGVASQLSAPFSLGPFQEKAVVFNLQARGAEQGNYPIVVKADAARESAERQFVLRVGIRAVQLDIAIAQTPVSYNFEENFTIAETNFTARSREPLPVTVSASLAGLPAEWLVEITPRVAGIQPGGEQSFAVRAVTRGRPTGDYYVNFTLTSQDGRTILAATRIAPLEACRASGITGCVVFGQAELFVVLAVAMLLIAAFLLLSAQKNVDDSRASAAQSSQARRRA